MEVGEEEEERDDEILKSAIRSISSGFRSVFWLFPSAIILGLRQLRLVF